MLSLLFVCCGVIKFHLSPTHTYTSSTFPIDHDSVVKNQFTNKNQNAPCVLTTRYIYPAPTDESGNGIKACCVYSMLNDSSITFEEPTFSVLFFSWYIWPPQGVNPAKTKVLAIKK
jgi:hypothetical protein